MAKYQAIAATWNALRLIWRTRHSAPKSSRCRLRFIPGRQAAESDFRHKGKSFDLPVLRPAQHSAPRPRPSMPTAGAYRTVVACRSALSDRRRHRPGPCNRTPPTGMGLYGAGDPCSSTAVLRPLSGWRLEGRRQNCQIIWNPLLSMGPLSRPVGESACIRQAPVPEFLPGRSLSATMPLDEGSPVELASSITRAGSSVTTPFRAAHVLRRRLAIEHAGLRLRDVQAGETVNSRDVGACPGPHQIDVPQQYPRRRRLHRPTLSRDLAIGSAKCGRENGVEGPRGRVDSGSRGGARPT